MFLKVVVYTVAFFLVGCNKNNDLGDSRKFEFTYEIMLDKSDSYVQVWFPVPKSSEVQSISNEIIVHDNLECEKLSESIHGNYYYYCENKNGLKDDIKIVYRCNVERREHGVVNYSNLMTKNYDKGTNNITVPEGDVFEDIINENSLSSKDMRSVYDYVLNGMHYGKPTNDKNNPNYKYVNGGVNKNTGQEWLPKDITYGRLMVNQNELVDKQNENDKYAYAYGNGNALYACDIGVGNCTDYHSYFMSLSRTLDVPARFHMGFNVPNKDISGSIGGYHCWADFYQKGEGWYPVDISEADKNPSKIDFFFGNLDFNRVEFTTGRDIELYNYEKHVNFFIYPLVEGTKFKKGFSYKNI
tara:strand:+ start:2344 stop:3411 length:1068 start_codon:yes stop_codon:yes gene_type:complete